MGRENYDIEPLRAAIVATVVADYCRALKQQNQGEITYLENWLFSEWGSLLCENKGDYIVKRCKEIAFERKRYHAAYIKSSKGV